MNTKSITFNAAQSLISILLSMVLLSGCTSEVEQPQHKVDFNHIQWFAERAAIAYEDKATITAQYQHVTLIETIRDENVLFFLEHSRTWDYQVVTIRGTANFANAEEDAEYLPVFNDKLGIYLHKGFDQDSTAIYQQLKPRLDKNKPVRITGHSLGAAIATVLMMHLDTDGYSLEASVNFGQPKLTNGDGVARFAHLPMTRVVDENDVVPMLPATTLLDSIHGIYTHLGPEVVLLEGVYYAFQDARQSTAEAKGSFWRNLPQASIEAHKMDHYLNNIRSKRSTAKQVPFARKNQFVDT
jgi:hypothetical protein